MGMVRVRWVRVALLAAIAAGAGAGAWMAFTRPPARDRTEPAPAELQTVQEPEVTPSPLPTLSPQPAPAATPAPARKVSRRAPTRPAPTPAVTRDPNPFSGLPGGGTIEHPCRGGCPGL